MVDFAGNELDPPYEEEVDGWFGGVLRMLEALWEFICAVVSAIADAVMAALSFLLDMLIGIINAIAEAAFAAVYSMFEGLIDGAESILSREVHSEIPIERFFVVTADLLGLIFSHPIFWCMVAAFTSLLAIEVIVKILTAGTAQVLDSLSGIVIDVVLNLCLGASLVMLSFAFGESETIQVLLEPISFRLSLLGFAVAVILMYEAKHSLKGVAKGMVRDIVGAALAIIGMFFVLFDYSADPYVDVYLDLFGISLGLIGAREAFEGLLDDWTLTGKAADAIAFGSLGVDVMKMLYKTYDI